MQIANISHIKKELQHKSQEELVELCLRLSKFKKENKELLNYLLFMESDRTNYIEQVKDQIDTDFEQINTTKYYWIKKTVRKVLRYTKKQIRFTLQKEVSIELLIHFCFRLKAIEPSIMENKTLLNLYNRQINTIQKDLNKLHEDLQYDYKLQLEKLM